MSDSGREMKVLITGESVNPTRIDLRAGKFTMVIDEPTSMGGVPTKGLLRYKFFCSP